MALKVLIVGVLGGELGYLSYLGAVALGAWIAGMRGGAAATIICAIAQTLLFSTSADRSLTPSVVFNLGLFLLDGALVTVLSSRLRRAYVRERSARTAGEADLEARVRAAPRGRAGPGGAGHAPGGDGEPVGRPDAGGGRRRDPRSRARRARAPSRVA